MNQQKYHQDKSESELPFSVTVQSVLNHVSIVAYCHVVLAKGEIECGNGLSILL